MTPDRFRNLVHGIPYQYIATIPHIPKREGSANQYNRGMCFLLQLWNSLRSTTEHTTGESIVLSTEFLVMTSG